MKILTFVIVLLCVYSGYSQEDAWVYLKDKPNADYYFSNPQEMLSQRSLDRRINQNILLDLKDIPLFQTYVDAIISAPGIEVKGQSKWLNVVHVRGDIDAIQNLSTYSFVDHIHFANRSLNSKRKLNFNSKTTTANKVNKVLETSINFDYGSSANQIQMLNANFLHQQNFTGNGKIIAVMDAGFPGVNVSPVFQRLRDNNQLLGGYNFVDKNDNYFSRNSHGTLVLSTMGGYKAGELVGTAPDASYYLFITEDADSENPIEETNWVQAAEMADSLGVDIINTSLGYFDYDNPNYSYTYEDMNGETSFISKGAAIAYSRGIVCVASAGNSGNNSLNPHIAVPADAATTVSIGAVKFDEIRASFSSIGPSFDGRIKPDIMAQGQAAVVASVSGTVGTADGTSFSGPIMSGAIASFWQAFPSLTNQQVVDFVKASSDRYSNPNNQYGYGIPDFQAAFTNAQLSVSLNSSDRFLVFPNPTHDAVFISYPKSFGEGSFLLYNTLGQIVFESRFNNCTTSFQITSLSSGVYSYKLQVNSIEQSGKIIKN